MDTIWDKLIKDHEGHPPESCAIEAMAWADDYLASLEHRLEYPDRGTVSKIRQQLKTIAKERGCER